MIRRGGVCGNTLGLYSAAPPHRFNRKQLQRMRNPFYQGNFCSECGNRLSARFSFRPRHFCDECAARLRQRSYFTPIAGPIVGLLLAASAAVFAFSYKSGGQPAVPPKPAAAVSAEDTIVNRSLKPATDATEKVFCGARTRRGTPCRQLVKPGQRCAQHQGRPSMLGDNAEPQRK